MPDFSGEEFPDRFLGDEWLRKQREKRFGSVVVDKPVPQFTSPGFTQVSRNVDVYEGVGLGNEEYFPAEVRSMSGEVVRPQY